MASERQDFVAGGFDFEAEPLRLLAAIVTSSHDAIVGKTPDGIIRSWNAAAERTFAIPARDAIGRHISIIIPPDRRAEADAIMARLMAGERVEHFETVRLRGDGRLVAVSLTISPILDDSGRLIAASKIARDISARVAADAALRASEERFRLLADHMSQLSWIADPSGDITWYNRRWFDYTGTTLEQMRGWGWQTVHHPDYVERVVARIRHSFATGEPWEDTFPLRGRDGEYRWFLSRAEPIRDERGQLVRWFGTNTDVTDLRQLQEHLRRLSSELAQVNHHKDEFLATLAHELRNPVAAVSTALSVIELAREDEARVARALAAAQRQVRQVTRLLEDLTDVSRVGTGKLVLERKPVDLAALLHDAVDGHRARFDIAGVSLHADVETAATVLGDAGRLLQVLSNLLTNALKYTPRSGSVWLTSTRDGRDVVVRLRDTGIGIPADMLAAVFDLFTQVDSGSARAQGGLGIGLALVKRLVELHGGTVEARSEGGGHGSEFIVNLPVLPE